MLLTRLVLPGMLKEKQGHIVLNSVLGRFASPLRTAYSTAKFGLRGFADSLRSEYPDQGLNVTSIYPGYVQTKDSRVAYNTRVGKNDKQVANGMSVKIFAQKAIKYIYLKDSDVIISKDWLHYVKNLLT